MKNLLIVMLLCGNVLAASTKKKTLDKKVQKQLIQVMEKNVTLHEAFFNYNADKVEDAADDMEDAIEEIKDPEIAKLLKQSKELLDGIDDDKTREDNNKAYHLISVELIKIKNTYDLGGKYAAFSCPMVNKKWIQSKSKYKKVMNPYDPSMPHCGSMDD